jgi:hypothetical protein
MTPMHRTQLAAAFLLFGFAPAAWAQSLAGAARQEGERRQTVKPSGKILTNKDLPAQPPVSVVPVTPGDAVQGAAPGQEAGQSAGTDAAGRDASLKEAVESADAASDSADSGDAKDGTAEKDADKGQQYWHNKMQGLQEQLRRDRTLADGMQSRINALTTDFVFRDDPQQRAVVGRNREAAIEELDRLKKSIANGVRAIADLEDEARRAGVPAGWLR